MVKVVTLLISSLLLLSCSQFETARGFDIQPGQYLVLNQSIDIQPDHTRRFIQHGKLTSRFAFDRRFQHCRIEVRDLAETTQTIQPGRFMISAIKFNAEAIAQSKPQLFAALTMNNALILSSNDDGPTEEMELVELYLQSDQQPNVMRLVCAGALSDGNPQDYPHSLRPYAQQISTILGTIAHFE